MVHYIDPRVELNPHPMGVDKAIQRIQHKLISLEWLQTIYGRAVVQRRQDVAGEIRGREITYPEVYFKGEPTNAMPNDNLTAYCFFRMVDPLTLPDATFGDVSMGVQGVEIYFWGNRRKIDPTKTWDWTEELRVEALQALSSAPDFTLTSSFMEIGNVFAPFTITDVYRPFIKPPYFAFKIVGTLRFHVIESCHTL